MGKTIELVRQEVAAMRGEVEDFANSAERVGGVVSDVLEYGHEQLEDGKNKHEALAERVTVAEGAIVENRQAIEAEVARATEKENQLSTVIGKQAGDIAGMQSNLSALTPAVLKNEEAIEAEVTRAQAAEQALGTEITEAENRVDERVTEVRDSLEEEVQARSVAVTDLNANTGISEYPAFDPADDYAVGDVVVYEGRLRRFVAEHAAGEWNGTDAEKWSERKEVIELGSEVRGKEIEGEYNTGKNISSVAIDSSGSMIAGGTGYQATYIPVTGGVKYKVRCYDLKLGYVAFYSEIPELGSKGTLIGSHPQQEEREYTYLTYTPKTDGYIAIGYYNGTYKVYQGVAEISLSGGLKENVENIEKTLSGKVDKVEGKQLSTNDYTNEDKNILESNNKSIESLTTDMYGEPSDSEEEIEAVNILYGKIIYSDIETDYLIVDSSSNQKLYFFPNTAKAKYKVTASVLNKYAGFWGYCNIIPETITGETQLEGKFIQTELRDTSSIQTFTIEDSENYNYLVVSKSPQISDIPTVAKIVVKYNGGVVGKSKETKELLDSIINGTWNDIGYTGKIDIADGNVLSFGSEVSEQEAMAITNDSEIEFVGFSTVPKKSNSYKSGENIVALNHDDLPKSDYIGTRKIYNKYDFHAHFCWIFSPYKSTAEFNDAVKNIRRLVADGHEVGLHAMIGASYWIVNIMNDIRPDGTSSFGFTHNDITTDVGEGKNVLGIALTSKLSSIYTNLKPTELANVVIGSATEQNILDANSKYCHYSDDSVVTGIDLEGVTQTWTCLKWIEYYYNNLVDNSLGYSSESLDMSEKFAEDYVGEYPSVQQLLVGDISNCGQFTKGLYKGCSSTCNYEVIDRCIEAALAFARKFLGVNTFVDIHRHGVKYIEPMWYEDGIYYRNREKTVVDGGGGRFYHSRTKVWKSSRDVFAQYGTKAIVQDGIRTHISVEGQTSLYYGQNGKTDDFGITSPKAYGYVGFPNICGVSGSGSVNGDYDPLITFISGIDDLTKYCYENAGATNVTRNGVTMEMVYKTLKESIDTIVSSIGTGAIPKLCFDTIKTNPAIQLATDLILRFIKKIGYRAVGFGEALEIAKAKRNCDGNMFPNPNFNQTLLSVLGDTTDESMKVPDGWKMGGQSGYTITVDNDIVDDVDCRLLKINATSYQNIHTSVYGLESGTYELSFYAASLNSVTDIYLFMLNNGDMIYGNGSESEWHQPIDNTELTRFTYRFTIGNERVNKISENPINQMCSGYEDNFCRLVIRLSVNKGAEFNFVMPTLKKVL